MNTPPPPNSPFPRKIAKALLSLKEKHSHVIWGVPPIWHFEDTLSAVSIFLATQVLLFCLNEDENYNKNKTISIYPYITTK